MRKFIQSLFALIDIIRFLSINVALGAVGMAVLTGYFFDIKLSWPPLFLLFLCVWLIYTFDHLLDVKKSKKINTPRHRFHKRLFLPLIMLWGSCFLLSVYTLISFVSYTIILDGIVLLIFVGLYFLLIHLTSYRYIPLLREFYIAIVYTLGVIIVPLEDLSFLNVEGVLFVIQIFCIAFVNLILFNLYEYDLMSSPKFYNKSLEKIDFINVKILLSFVLLSSFFLCIIGNQKMVVSEIIIIIMTLCLIVIFLFPEYFKEEERYRKLGDAVFLYPWVLVAFF